jgi:hypothetical protein
VQRVLEDTAREPDLSSRLDSISACFLARPYIENSLIGGRETPEVLTISLNGFDCVTYIETVLALAVSTTIETFIKRICELRYEGGEIAWTARNHYMIDWARNNKASGLIDILTEGPGSVKKTRVLSSIEGLPAKHVTFECCPKRRLARLSQMCKTGDVILFVSTKKTLDVFHVGLLIERKHALVMRHATRTAGRVIEQELEDFVKSNRMSGLIVLRPSPFDCGF